MFAWCIYLFNYVKDDVSKKTNIEKQTLQSAGKSRMYENGKT